MKPNSIKKIQLSMIFFLAYSALSLGSENTEAESDLSGEPLSSLITENEEEFLDESNINAVSDDLMATPQTGTIAPPNTPTTHTFNPLWSMNPTRFHEVIARLPHRCFNGSSVNRSK